MGYFVAVPCGRAGPVENVLNDLRSAYGLAISSSPGNPSVGSRYLVLLDHL
jgi:hypothetical protein